MTPAVQERVIVFGVMFEGIMFVGVVGGDTLRVIITMPSPVSGVPVPWLVPLL